MKILVTGATGFIGNHVVQQLLLDDSNEIIITSRSAQKAKSFAWYEQVLHIEYDFSVCDEKNLYNLFSQPDVLIHLGWEGVSDCRSLEHIGANLFNHYKFIKNMIEQGLKDILVAGTCLEYGKDGLLSEGMVSRPSSSYAIAKDSLRKFIELLAKEYEFDYKWVRLFYMFGEGQSERSILSLVDRAARDDEKIFNMSAGEQLRDYMHVSDVSKDIVFIAKQSEFSGIINCCSGKPISIRTLVENHIEKMNYKLELNLGYYPYVDYEPMAFWGDDRKLKNLKDK